MEKIIIVVVMVVVLGGCLIVLGGLTAFLINYLGFWTTLTWQQGLALNTLVGVLGSFFHSASIYSKK